MLGEDPNDQNEIFFTAISIEVLKRYAHRYLLHLIKFLFFSIEAHQKRKWHNFWFRAVYKATISYKNVQYIWNNENSISHQNPNSNKITYETTMNSIQNKANNETI